LDPIPIPGRLIALRVTPRGFRSFTLYLFTTLADPLQCPVSELAQLYGLRWNIELCFRYIKAQMDLGFLQCRSALT
jgi:IS4 transposase